MKDPNNNISEAIADELGLVKVMAVFGKGNEADDLIGLNEFSSSDEDTLVNNFFHARLPASWLRMGKTCCNMPQHDLSMILTFIKSQESGSGCLHCREEHFQKKMIHLCSSVLSIQTDMGK